MYDSDEEKRDWKSYRKSSGLHSIDLPWNGKVTYIAALILLIGAYFALIHVGYIFPFSSNARADKIASRLDHRAIEVCLSQRSNVRSGMEIRQIFVPVTCGHVKRGEVTSSKNQVEVSAHFMDAELVDTRLYYEPYAGNPSTEAVARALSDDLVRGALCFHVNFIIEELSEHHWSDYGSATYADGITIQITLLDQHGTPIKTPISLSAQTCTDNNTRYSPDGSSTTTYHTRY